jgi:hypothetical protein
MITYNLQINEMRTIPEIDGNKDVVIHILWAYIANDDITKTNAGFGGSSSFTYSGGEFVPFSELTKDQVTEWIMNSESELYWSSLQAMLLDNLNTAAKPAPWIEPPEILEFVDPPHINSPTIEPTEPLPVDPPPTE